MSIYDSYERALELEGMRVAKELDKLKQRREDVGKLLDALRTIEDRADEELLVDNDKVVVEKDAGSYFKVSILVVDMDEVVKEILNNSLVKSNEIEWDDEEKYFRITLRTVIDEKELAHESKPDMPQKSR